MIFSSKVPSCPVRLEKSKCKGCVHCMRKCPTEAIRVRDGKAKVVEARCVGCGDCVRSCPTRAKLGVSDPIVLMNRYRYKIALLHPASLGQFSNLDNIDIVLQGLINLGFDDVEEVGIGSEIVSCATREYLARTDIPRPVISSACPAIVKLIQISYGHLAPHLSPVLTPEEVSAGLARKRAAAMGYERDEVGVFLISPCSAKWEAYRESAISGVFAFESLYFRLVTAMKSVVDPPHRSRTGKLGLSWANSSGEADGTKTTSFLAADGVDNCRKVLDEIDHGKMNDLDFVELNACPGGCVGGIFNIENPFLASTRIRLIRRKTGCQENEYEHVSDYQNREIYAPDNVFRLSEDRGEAMRILQMIECLHAALPGIDCGSCGAPSCRAMAEDIALYGMQVDDCPFLSAKHTGSKLDNREQRTENMNPINN